MKIKHLIMVSLILAVLTIGAVSAAEEAEDVTAMENTEDTIITSVENEDLSSDGEDMDETVGEGKEIDMEVTDVPKTVKFDEAIKFNVSINDADATGKVYVYVDYESYWNKESYDINESFDGKCQYSDGVSSFGNHTLYVKYSGDDNYASKVLKFNFTVEDYVLTIDDTYGDAIFGNDYKLHIDIPNYTRGVVIVTYKGVQYTVKCDFDDDVYVTIPSKELEYGLNKVTIHHVPNQFSDFNEKTVDASFNCTAKIIGPDKNIEYGEVEEIILSLPANATGNLTVKINGGKSKNITLNNGKASFPLNELGFGEYSIEASYTGEDYAVSDETFEFKVIPKINAPKYVYSKLENYTVTVTLPDNAKGRLKIRNAENPEEIVYDELTNGTKIINVPLSALNIKISYEEGNYTYENDFSAETRDTNPVGKITIDSQLSYMKEYMSRHIFYVYNPEDMLDGYDSVFTIYDYPGTGYYILYIDDNEYGQFSSICRIDEHDDIAIGNHTYRLEYVDPDNYYTMESKSGTLTVKYIVFNVEGGGISVRSFENVTGQIILFIDGEYYGAAVLNTEDNIDFDDLSYGEHTYSVTYSGNFPEASKSGTFTKEYYFSFYLNKNLYSYGENVVVTVDMNEYAQGNLSLKLGDKIYYPVSSEFTFHGLNAKFIISDLEIGDYNISVMFAGEGHVSSRNASFTVNGYSIVAPQSMFYGDDEYISLKLPKNATGNLTVTVDGENFANVKLKDGYANVSLKSLNKTSKIVASYTGEDYDIEYLEDTLEVYYLVEYSLYVKLNETAWISVVLPEDFEGNISLEFRGMDPIRLTPSELRNYTFDLKRFGWYYFEVKNEGQYVYFMYEYNWPEIYVIPNNIIYPKNGSTDFILELPEDANGTLTLSYGDNSIITKVNGSKTIVSLADVYGTYSFSGSYSDEKYGYYGEIEFDFVHKYSNTGENVTIPKTVSNGGFDVVLHKEAIGMITAIIDGKKQFVPIVNGSAKVNLSDLPAGNHNITIKYKGDKLYEEFEKTATILVPGNESETVPAKIIANDLTALYTAGSRYSVTVYGTDGKLANGVQVVFKINGKQVGSAKTVNGIATYKVVQIPGTYKITAEALGKTVTKKLTVKHVLKLQKVKVKRSAKKLVIKVTLSKVNGKYLKSKKITLKFKGKRYTAKTSSKGVAKFTIKKNVLKKLKAGKKVTYQATYLKDTVKYTVKVKR